MPTELVTVTEVAREFLAKNGHQFIRLDKGQLDPETGRWRLTFDVGLLKPLLKTVIIEDATGKVVGFE